MFGNAGIGKELVCAFRKRGLDFVAQGVPYHRGSNAADRQIRAHEGYPLPSAFEKGQKARLAFVRIVRQAKDGRSRAAHQLIDLGIERFRWFDLQSQLAGDSLNPPSEPLFVGLSKVFGQSWRFHRLR
jgi:hypothetical protein